MIFALAIWEKLLLVPVALVMVVFLFGAFR